VATAANVTVVLHDAGWGACGMGEPVWSAIVLAVATLLPGATTLMLHDSACALVPAWSGVGMALKIQGVSRAGVSW